jgi:membrane fusion protein, macrolide-specific efflux system
MKKNNILRNLIIIAIAAGLLVLFLVFKGCAGNKKAGAVTNVVVTKGNIKLSINSTGSVMPQNRLEIKPPMSGRVEKILVVEGQRVKLGQTLAYMSSSDRAAIIDAARAQGQKNLKQWEDIYKLIPLVAPINGEVIVASVQPGQTVSQTDAIVVLSDRLIVQAQVDETDIGKVRLGQVTNITLDAYPNKMVAGKVDHIYYESKTVNNVTIYNVDILPDSVPDFFRSGMSANVDIVQQEKKDTLLLPSEAVKKDRNDGNFVLVPSKDKKTERKQVVTGLADNDNTEIVSGLSEGDTVMIVKQNYFVQKKDDTTSPFMPKRPGQNTKSSAGGTKSGGGPPF